MFSLCNIPACPDCPEGKLCTFAPGNPVGTCECPREQVETKDGDCVECLGKNYKYKDISSKCLIDVILEFQSSFVILLSFMILANGLSKSISNIEQFH